MNARRVVTPVDLEPFVGAHDSVVNWVGLPPAVEKLARPTVAAIFDDFGFIESGDRPIVTAYLEGIEEPLKTLTGLGLQILVIQTSGTYKAGETVIPGWRRA